MLTEIWEPFETEASSTIWAVCGDSSVFSLDIRLHRWQQSALECLYNKEKRRSCLIGPGCATHLGQLTLFVLLASLQRCLWQVVGIDLGTTNSAVAAMEGGKPTIVTNVEGAKGLLPCRMNMLSAAVSQCQPAAGDHWTPDEDASDVLLG